MTLPGHRIEHKKASSRASRMLRSPMAQIREQGAINVPFRNAAGKSGLVDSRMVAFRNLALEEWYSIIFCPGDQGPTCTQRRHLPLPVGFSRPLLESFFSK